MPRRLGGFGLRFGPDQYNGRGRGLLPFSAHFRRPLWKEGIKNDDQETFAFCHHSRPGLVFSTRLPGAERRRREAEGIEVPEVWSRHANRNILFGMPSPAKADPKQREDYLIERPQYSLSYNAQNTRSPTGFAGHCARIDIGKAAREPFSPDPLLPAGIAKVTSHVYDDSGFDRGHQCPAQDREFQPEADMDMLHVLHDQRGSAIAQQQPAAAGNAWSLTVATWQRKGDVLLISCGPQGVGGVGKHGP